MPSRFWKLSADRMPTTPEEVLECMERWYGRELWGERFMSITAFRFQRAYYAARDVLMQDPVTAYATAWRALYGPTTTNEETPDAQA